MKLEGPPVWLASALQAASKTPMLDQAISSSKITHKKGHHHRTGTEAVGAGGALGKAEGTATGTSSSDASLTNSATGADAGASDHASASAAPGERAYASRASSHSRASPNNGARRTRPWPPSTTTDRSAPSAASDATSQLFGFAPSASQ